MQHIVSANIVLLRMVTAAVSPHFFSASIYFFGILHFSLYLSHFFKDRIVEDGSHIEFNACSLYHQTLIGFLISCTGPGTALAHLPDQVQLARQETPGAREKEGKSVPEGMFVIIKIKRSFSNLVTLPGH